MTLIRFNKLYQQLRNSFLENFNIADDAQVLTMPDSVLQDPVYREYL